MRVPSRRGTVLVHVLITAVFVLVITASLARMLMTRYAAVARANEGVAGRKAAESTFNQLLTSWASTGEYCRSVPGYSCSGSAGITSGNCGCTCSPSPACTCAGPGSCPATVSTSWNGTSCTLSITTCP